MHNGTSQLGDWACVHQRRLADRSLSTELELELDLAPDQHIALFTFASLGSFGETLSAGQSRVRVALDYAARKEENARCFPNAGRAARTEGLPQCRFSARRPGSRNGYITTKINHSHKDQTNSFQNKKNNIVYVFGNSEF